MQLAPETLIREGLESSTARLPEHAEAMGGENEGVRFADLLRGPATETPSEAADSGRPVAGSSLPAAGNTLPANGDLTAAAGPAAGTAATGELPLQYSFADTLPDADPVAHGQSSAPVDENPGSNQVGGERETVLPEFVADLAGARGAAAGTVPTDAELPGQDPPAVEGGSQSQIAPDSSGNPAPVVPPFGAVQDRPPSDSLRGRRAGAHERSGVGDSLQQLATHAPARGAAPASHGPANRLAADSHPGHDDDAATPAFAKSHDDRTDAANRALQELTTLKTPAATRAADLALPTGQPAMATVPLGGASPAPSISATVPVVTIDTPVLDPMWADALQDRVVWLAGREVQIARIRLNPAELGPLQVQISVDDNSVDIVFTATHAVTREALESVLPRLRDSLAEHGMLLADASVSDQGIADRRDDGNRRSLAEFDPGAELSTSAVDDVLPGRSTIKDPSVLVDTYI